MFFGQVFGLSGRRLSDRVEIALEIAGLVGRDREPAQHFSGGMKRRLNIAIGLLHDPDILILDEPTVGVDAQSRSAILSALEQLNQGGTTIIYCTHYMEEAERLCGRVAIIDHGRVIAEDSPRTLVRSLGDGIIELELSAPLGSADLDRIRQCGTVRLSGNDDTTVSLHVTEPASVVADLMQSLREWRIPVRSLRLLEPNLEAVFLRLTGRQLRD
jgi:ABC-2 type transport system ATP-binding protein